MDNFGSRVFSAFQKLGKSLMLPIAALPVAALLLRFGVLLNFNFMTAAGAAVFDNLALIFGIGVAIGLSKDGNGAAGLAGAISHFVIIKGAQAINADINMGVLSGIIGGILAAYCYNKYSTIKLPSFLGFFAGKRFVPIIAGLLSIVLAVIAGYVWPFFQNGLSSTSNWIIGSGAFGLFIFGTLNRLLLPLGLHHVLNTYFWFQHGEFNGTDGVVNGDLTRFFAGDPNAGDFMAGFYPIMMFALPAAALAMYIMAKKERRTLVAGVLFSIAFTSFLTGITEPIEFAFMFLAPVLYIFHALLTGAALAISHVLGIKHGFGFSAGLIDYILNFNLSTNGILIIVLGLVFGIVYFLLFTIVIKKYKLSTIGREEEEEEYNEPGSLSSVDSTAILAALGGLANINSVDSCVTRLRLSLVDSSKVDESKIKSLGSRGIIKPTANTMQIILGQEAEGIADAINALKK